MKLQVLTTASMWMAVSWDVTQYSLVDIYRRFSGSYCRLQLPCWERDSTLFWDGGQYLPDWMAPHPRRQVLSVRSEIHEEIRERETNSEMLFAI